MTISAEWIVHDDGSELSDDAVDAVASMLLDLAERELADAEVSSSI